MKQSIALAGLVLAGISCRAGAGADAGPTGSSLGIRDGSSNIIERKYAKPVDAVWNAVVQSADESGLIVENARNDAFGGWLNARRVDDTKVSIEVKSLNNTTTLVAVHVSGDRIIANRIHSLIGEKLGLGAQGGAAEKTQEGS